MVGRCHSKVSVGQYGVTWDFGFAFEALSEYVLRYEEFQNMVPLALVDSATVNLTM
jgi:hypothetical protein